jgi:hypothetical protein
MVSPARKERVTSDYLKIITRKSLAASDAALMQVWFDAAVLDRYRELPDYKIIRTDSAGRVRKEGGWSLDFGIAPDNLTIHASWSALASALPERERDHWSAHAALPSGIGENFLRMQLAPGSCFDDGEVKDW